MRWMFGLDDLQVSTADLVLVLLVHLVHWYLVHRLIGTSGALLPGTLVPTVT